MSNNGESSDCDSEWAVEWVEKGASFLFFCEEARMKNCGDEADRQPQKRSFAVMPVYSGRASVRVVDEAASLSRVNTNRDRGGVIVWRVGDLQGRLQAGVKLCVLLLLQPGRLESLLFF